MRDNAKSGALTEVTYFVLLALYEARHGYAIMQFVEECSCTVRKQATENKR